MMVTWICSPGTITVIFTTLRIPELHMAPSFATEVENPFGLTDIGSTSRPTFADLDNDGDLDMISGDRYSDFFYFENTGTATAPAFAAPEDNLFDFTGTGDITSPTFLDLDNDGDLDMLSGEKKGSFFYFENTGTSTAPAFATPEENPFGFTSIGGYSTPTFADLDNDGDLDMLAGIYFGNFYYFENIANNAPTVSNAIANQSTEEEEAWSFQFATDVFNDENTADILTYTATLADESALPAWLSFTPATRTFAGTPTSDDVGTIAIKVTATDNGAGSLSVADEFDLTVNAKVVSAIRDLKISNDLIVFANKNTLTININEQLNNATLNIYTSNGALVKQVNRVHFNRTDWSIPFHEEGLFILTVQSENKMFIKKFIK